MAGSKRIILSLSWRDIKSPKAGGAEIHTHEFLKAIDRKKFRVVHISFMYDGLPSSEETDGIRYLRHGSYLSYLSYARRFYLKHLDRIALVLDQCNTWRAFTPLWVRPEHRVFYIHQLTREIWHIQSKGLFAWLGEHTETLMLRLNRHDRCITVSESTKADLAAVGFDPEKIAIIPNGIPETLVSYEGKAPKEKDFTLIYVGRYARYKGIDDTIEAFGRLKKRHPGIKLRIVGKPDEEYLKSRLIPICDRYGLSIGRRDKDIPAPENRAADVTILGFVEEEKKYRLMQSAHLLICPSVREGWGIIISEAAFLGTPSVVYDSPGLRDAVDRGKAGLLCNENTVGEIVRQTESVMEDPERYEEIRASAKEFASGLRWEKNVERVNSFIENAVTPVSRNLP